MRICALLALLLTFPAFATPTDANAPALGLGASWYPEQWPRERWDKDLTGNGEAR